MIMSSFAMIGGKGGQNERGDYHNEQKGIKAVGSK